MKPLVSVIIPVYNVLSFLREALDSVISQTYQNLEILLVDDGSTDGSGEVCDEYKADSRVRVIHQENRGISGARNTGLDQMTGEYVAFLDPDDAFHTDMIGTMMEALLKHKAELAICGFNIFETEGSLQQAARTDYVRFPGEEEFTDGEICEKLLRGKIPVAAWNKVYKREVWRKLRFPEGHVYEDIFIISSVLNQCGRTVIVPRILADHRKRRESITQTFTARNLRDYILSVRNALAHAEKRNPPPAARSIQLFRGNCINGIMLYWAKMRRAGGDQEELRRLKNEILDFAKEGIYGFDLKTQGTLWLFRHVPGAIIPVWRFYRGVIRLLKTGR